MIKKIRSTVPSLSSLRLLCVDVMMKIISVLMKIIRVMIDIIGLMEITGVMKKPMDTVLSLSSLRLSGVLK